MRPRLVVAAVLLLGLIASPALAVPTSGLPVPAHAVAVCPPVAGRLHCAAQVLTDAKGLPAMFPFPVGYAPRDLQSAYALTAAAATRGRATTVGVVAPFDDPSAEADMNHYRAYFGLPRCTSASGCFTRVNEFGASVTEAATEGGTISDGSGNVLGEPTHEIGLETSLDLDMVAAICPRCRVLLVEAATSESPDMALAANTAARLGAVAVSTSYGGPEDQTEVTTDHLYDTPGTIQTASTGDDGYGTGYPATSPYVVAVGGTTLINAAGPRGFAETAWSGAGSGCSTFESKPSYQTDDLCLTRSLADVAAVADPLHGVAVYDSFVPSGKGGWFEAGGTSASSPIIAAVFALAGNTAGKAGAAYLYSHHRALFDVVGGANKKGCADYTCRAVPGYDGPTGWGTPNGIAAF